MEELKPIIAHNIAALRQQAGLTQQELAEALHYSDKAVSKWERGESIPDVGVLKQIADRFGVTVDSLLRSDASDGSAVQKAEYLRKRKIITAIALTGTGALGLLISLLLHTWLPMLYALPAASIVWLVLNALWFSRRRNYVIVSVLMWTLLLSLCVTLWYVHAPMWELLWLGLPGQGIIWLCSRFGRKA